MYALFPQTVMFFTASKQEEMNSRHTGQRGGAPWGELGLPGKAAGAARGAQRLEEYGPN